MVNKILTIGRFIFSRDIDPKRNIWSEKSDSIYHPLDNGVKIKVKTYRKSFTNERYIENKGKIIENEVALELKRRISIDKDFEIYYWKDYVQNEVDFVLKKDKKIEQLIQVSYINSKEEIKEREIKALLKAGKELKCKNLLIITWNYESEEKIKNSRIIFIPLWKWLME